MAKLTRESLVKRVFSDLKNYPYGFSRSRDFSINESKALAQHGCLIAALVDGEIEPSNAQDEGLLDAAFANKEPESISEKALVKYQKRINRPKPANIYGNRIVVSDTDDDDTDNTAIDEDSDIELEIDD